MKIDRCLGILSVLLQKDKVTAPELAEMFEVSRRTISRDIETLSNAGIPIVTRQGSSGGISVMPSYRLDRTILTETEMEDIIAGLRGLESVDSTKNSKRLMEKLKVDSSDFVAGDQSILIDLSGWYAQTLGPKIKLIREAIKESELVEFEYYSPNSESHRVVEPYYLIFKWSSWYLWSYCLEREDYRLFKLNRMDSLKVLKAGFQRRKAPVPELKNEEIFYGGIEVEAVFDPSCRWRLVEDFGVDSFEELPDGRLLFRADYTNKDNLLSWLISFRDKVTLIKPRSLRDEMRDLLEAMALNYRENSERKHLKDS